MIDQEEMQKKIIPYLNFDFIYEEGLVLYGINALYELNKNSA